MLYARAKAPPNKLAATASTLDINFESVVSLFKVSPIYGEIGYLITKFTNLLRFV